MIFYVRIRKALLFTALFFGSGASAAKPDPVICFDFEIHANTSRAIAIPFTETWCYQKRSLSQNPELLIFEVNQQNEVADRSLLVGYGSDGTTISNLSLSRRKNGEMIAESIPDPSLNPIAAPLSLLEAAQRGKPRFVLIHYANEGLEKHFIKHMTMATSGIDIEKAFPGDYAFTISNEHFPFNGFWWSQAGLPTAAGENSPLGLFDLHEEKRTGVDPGSRLWEAKRHSGNPTIWGGHCNGWAASSVLYPEPTQTRFDPTIQKVITPYALKGMLAEASFCVKEAFYGTRYNTGKDDLLDIYPDLFHKILTYYIRDLKSPVLMDYVRAAPVDNHVITGYHFQISELAPDTVHVNAVLTVAGYDIEQRDSLGPAHTYERKYSYTLKLNDKKEIVSGTWDLTSDNPDFMWVPIGASPNCSGDNNPNIQAAQVLSLIEQLEPTKARVIPILKTVNETLIPQGQVPLPELLISTADHLKLKFQVESLVPINPSSGARLMLIISGEARYPIKGGVEESIFIPLGMGNQEIELDRLVSIKSGAIVNQSETQSYFVKISFSELSYIGN